MSDDIGRTAVAIIRDLIGPTATLSGTNCRVVEDHLRALVAATPSTDARFGWQAEERERCARIVDTWPAVAGVKTLKHIVAAIRSGETQVGEGRGIPDGYALVPIVPTEAMWAAGREAVNDQEPWSDLPEIWSVMVAAARSLPDAPAAEVGHG